jgi:hypothetical protein
VPNTSGWEPLWTFSRNEPASIDALARLVKCPKCRALVEDKDSLTHELECAK